MRRRRLVGAPNIIPTIAVIVLCGIGGAAPGSSPEEPPQSDTGNSVVNTRLRATGRGRPPARAMSKPQLRLMAKRAAMIEAYKNMTRAVGEVRSCVVDGTGYETVSGYIKGIELSSTRYYANGEVEVDIELVMPTRGGPGEIHEPPRQKRSSGEERLLMVESEGGTISETEWRRVFGERPPPGQ